MKKLALITLILLVSGCAVKTNSMTMVKTVVGDGIDRYENSEVVCYITWGLSGERSMCKFKATPTLTPKDKTFL